MTKNSRSVTSNGLVIETKLIFDKKPEEQTKIIRPEYLNLSNGIQVMSVSNGAKIVKMTIEATGCSYSKNKGRCSHTEPSQAQVYLHRAKETSRTVLLCLIM